MGIDAVNLTEVGTARQSLQRAADGEGGRRLGAPFAAWGGPWTSGGRLLLGELGQQLLNGAVAFSARLEVELVSREVLAEREPMLRAIIAGQGGNELLVRGVAVMVAMGGQLS